MHGRPRKALKEEDAAALSAKAEKLRSLQSHFLANHQNRMFVPYNPLILMPTLPPFLIHWILFSIRIL